MKPSLKIRIALCGKKSVDVIEEIRKSGERLGPAYFSNVLNKRIDTPKAKAILTAAEEIVGEWEKQKKSRKQA